ncbi:MAG: hypothetical protein WAP47_04305 [Candidatus Rokuibacteriota bacterium]
MAEDLEGAGQGCLSVEWGACDKRREKSQPGIAIGKGLREELFLVLEGPIWSPLPSYEYDAKSGCGKAAIINRIIEVIPVPRKVGGEGVIFVTGSLLKPAARRTGTTEHTASQRPLRINTKILEGVGNR